MRYSLLRYSFCFTDSRIFPFFFFFNDTATTEIYTLSLHDALPISTPSRWCRKLPLNSSARPGPFVRSSRLGIRARSAEEDRKSTRLNSSHGYISYAVFCLKKKKQNLTTLSLPERARPP